MNTTAIDIDLFDTDERLWINKAAAGLPIADFTRQRFLDNLNFTLNIFEDTMITNLAEGLKVKVSHLSDDEWSALSTKLPFPASYDDTMSLEVPEDEDEAV